MFPGSFVSTEMLGSSLGISLVFVQVYDAETLPLNIQAKEHMRMCSDRTHAHKIFKPKFLTHKIYNAKLSRSTVCMFVCTTWKGLCISYLEDGMYVCTCVLRALLYVYVHPTWWLCLCVYTHIHTYHSGTPQVGHT